jgi:glycosyltransferase involved in cell wall biosynthesis
MTIAFVHPHKAFLPEVIAYADFFTARGITTNVVHPGDLAHTQCDVEWHFMGQHTRRHSQRITIHEYASASVPPFSRLKDSIKKWINTTPHYRIFNNNYVLQQFCFKDKVPFGLRNYGIPDDTDFLQPSIAKQYDFVYVGTLDKGRRPELLLDCFATGALQQHSLLVLSRSYAHLQQQYGSSKNIIFKGPVPYQDVYAHLQQARFGINYMPDILPYNQQTAAKFLDYAACRLPVVTTDYTWVRNFQQQYGGHYFYLQPQLQNFTWEHVTGFTYSAPALGSWTWSSQIKGCGVVDFLNRQFPGLLPA